MMTLTVSTSNDNELDNPKKRKYPGFRRNLIHYWTEYSNNTGIHGLKYLGEQERSILEKLWWFVLFCISLYICIIFIIQTWMKWDTSPVLVSFAKNPTSVWQIPFPAITICPETKSRQRVFNFTDMYHKIINEENVTQEELRKFLDTALVCDNPFYKKGDQFANLSTVDFLTSISPQFQEVLWNCKWTLQNMTCDQLLTPMLTEDGNCFTFNMLDRSELYTNNVHFDQVNEQHGRAPPSEGWTLEDGYPPTAAKYTFPRRVLSAGDTAGLFLLLRAYEQDLDYVCRGPVQGFKVFLHHPSEIPSIRTQYFRAPLNQEVVALVKPDIMGTSEGLKDYEPHRRQCYFSKERQLMFYSTYTEQNCQVECLTNHTLETCGCVAYHMPRKENTKIFGPGSILCMSEVKNELVTMRAESGLSSESHQDSCDCLPSCISLTYNVETSQVDFNWAKLFQAFKANSSEFPGIQITRLSIFFKETQFITLKRYELYGRTDFLANCGGLLGLFTGFSFLSIVEVIYFLSLRLICNVKIYGRQFWSGST